LVVKPQRPVTTLWFGLPRVLGYRYLLPAGVRGGWRSPEKSGSSFLISAQAGEWRSF
jgi:hypothetical protein